MKERFTFETCLVVEEFYSEARALRTDHDDEKEHAFDVAGTSQFYARRSARADLRAVLEKAERKVKIVELTFCEFDSGRMHAGAHWNVVVETDRETMEKFIKGYYGDDADIADYLTNAEPELPL